MTSTILPRRTLAALCLAGLMTGATALAQTAPPQDTPPADAAAAAEPGDKADDNKVDRRCVQYTGSRIRGNDPTGKRNCQKGPGSAYSKDDLDSTGQVDIGRALQHLDPSIKSN